MSLNDKNFKFGHGIAPVLYIFKLYQYVDPRKHCGVEARNMRLDVNLFVRQKIFAIVEKKQKFVRYRSPFNNFKTNLIRLFELQSSCSDQIHSNLPRTDPANKNKKFRCTLGQWFSFFLSLRTGNILKKFGGSVIF